MIWKIIGNVMSFMGKCKRDKINAYSAQSAFFIILSLIPFLMVFSSLLQYTSVTEGTLLKIIERVMPEYIAPFLISLIDEVYNRSAGYHFHYGDCSDLVRCKGCTVYDGWA